MLGRSRRANFRSSATRNGETHCRSSSRRRSSRVSRMPASRPRSPPRLNMSRRLSTRDRPAQLRHYNGSRTRRGRRILRQDRREGGQVVARSFSRRPLRPTERTRRPSPPRSTRPSEKPSPIWSAGSRARHERRALWAGRRQASAAQAPACDVGKFEDRRDDHAHYSAAHRFPTKAHVMLRLRVPARRHRASPCPASRQRRERIRLDQGRRGGVAEPPEQFARERPTGRATSRT